MISLARIFVVAFFLLGAVRLSSAQKFVPIYEGSHFFVNLINCPDECRDAIEYSFRCFDSLIVTNIPINVNVFFKEQTKNNVAATAQAVYRANFSDVAIENVLYPIPLVEKILNAELNDSNESDIDCYVDLSVNWHFGLDTNVPEGKLDFIQIFLHEICHGMGFQSFVRFEGQMLDENTWPSIFDIHIVDKEGKALLYELPSERIYSQVTNNSLYYKSPHFAEYYKDSLVKLYAPSVYSEANSIQHVDEVAYTDENRLLSPSHGLGESTRGLGSIAKSLLLDFGWGNPVLNVKKCYDTENLDDSSAVVLNFESDYSVAQNVKLEYSLDNFGHQIEIPMNGKQNVFSSKIPPFMFNNTVAYRITYDYGGFTYSIPCDSCSIEFYRGIDTIAPSVEIDFPNYLHEHENNVELTFGVNENSGISHINIHDDSGNVLVETDIDNGSHSIIIDNNKLELGDTLKLYVQVYDYASNRNTYYDTIIKPIVDFGDVVRTYATNFDDVSANDFILNGFDISMNKGFSSKSLNSEHAYKSPNKEHDTLEFFAELNYNVILDSVHHYLSFDEIVLVEPSDEGKAFGEFGFWDYVVVEGSKDNENWFAFEKEGYDSWLHDSWLLAYNSEVKKADENNLLSEYVPEDESLYRSHSINLLENKYLRKGDTVRIRFLLVSDAYSNGWGWSIDNLTVQEGAGVVADERTEDEIYILPNPAGNVIRITGKAEGSTYQIVDVLGNRIVGGKIDKDIPVADLPTGIYFVTIADLDNRILVKTFMKK